jgi:hypothetical protein
MNKFQNLVRRLALKKDQEDYEALVKEHGKFEDYIDVVETEHEHCTSVEFIEKDPEGYERWCKAMDSLKPFKVLKREAKAELRKGPRL